MESVLRNMALFTLTDYSVITIGDERLCKLCANQLKAANPESFTNLPA